MFLQDYTLIHYDVNAWEGKAYAYGLQWLQEAGCPVEGLKFDPDLVIRGLIVDKQLGNLVKVDRFGCAPCLPVPCTDIQRVCLLRVCPLSTIFGMRRFVGLHHAPQRWHWNTSTHELQV